MSEEFNLSEKRKELFEDLLKEFKEVKEIEKILFVVLNSVDDQDKEFIRLLARESYFDKERKCWVVSLKVVKERAGSDLIEEKLEEKE